jgi:hypothetical protein
MFVSLAKGLKLARTQSPEAEGLEVPICKALLQKYNVHVGPTNHNNIYYAVVSQEAYV